MIDILDIFLFYTRHKPSLCCKVACSRAIRDSIFRSISINQIDLIYLKNFCRNHNPSTILNLKKQIKQNKDSKRLLIDLGRFHQLFLAGKIRKKISLFFSSLFAVENQAHYLCWFGSTTAIETICARFAFEWLVILFLTRLQ